ncbi:putative sodium/potassium/calcium exchanger [Natrinema versiforme]|uniref:PGF-CTERM sorting domain-containing protein n=1 Tax=Natrinema versiforme JCM 10478 TaxID=1227496 RepID=L9Y201_9EURY|nr:hypothetical protein [Natrinema versiforme]ELY68045.1 hypothetical protein C489_08575 [Natrinema versiforme JCM 10478]
MNRGATLVVALLVATSAVTMAAAAGATTTTTATGSSTTTQSDAYAGAHVAFDVQGDAIANYSVDGEQAFSSVAVQSQSEADADAGLDASTGLEAATDLSGAGLSLATQTQASAEIQADSGATLSAHDNQHGTLVVESGDEAQYVEADLGASAEAREDGDRVVVETGDREGAFLVVGDGEVTVADGNVTADLGENATLAFRSYDEGERDEQASYEESLITEGNAAVEVTADHRDGETVSDAVTYGQETSAEAATTANGTVEMTIDRTTHEGTVVLTTVSEEAVGSLENLSVTVDGEAAVEASSKSDLEGAIGSDESRYMVAQDTQAEGQATVYVAVNHFSERTATIDGASAQDESTDESDGSEIESDDEGSTDEESADGSAENETTDGSDDSVSGFGAGAAALALLTGVGARVRR